MPAGGASLRRIRGRDLLNPAESFFLQSRCDKPPSAPTDRTVQSALLGNSHAGPLDSSSRSACHRSHVKCFDPDRVEAASDVSCDFFDPVFTPIDISGLQFRDRSFGPLPPVRTVSGSGKPLLQHL